MTRLTRTLLPLLVLATTHLNAQGAAPYGLDPFKVESSDSQRGVQGNNERVSIENVGVGVKYVDDILRYAQ